LINLFIFIKAGIKIIRLYNCLFVLFTVFLGAFFLSFDTSMSILPKILFVGLSAFFIAAGGYVINDVYDYEIDKINKPNRVLPSRKMKLNTAYVFSICLFLIGIVFAILTYNIWCILIALINSILLYNYAKHFKKIFLIGNLVVAWNASSTFIFGALITLNLKNIISLVLISFFYTLLREFIKCIEDYEGDKADSAKTITVLLGLRKTLYLSYIPAMITVLSFNLMYILNQISIELFYILNIIIVIPFIVFYYIMHKSLHRVIVANVQKYMKLNMLSIVLLYVVYDFFKVRI